MSVTVEEMKAQVSKINALRGKEAELSQAKKVVTDELELEEKKMIEMLEASDLTQFRGEEGLAFISYKTSVKTPKTEEDRAAFFQYLKDKGLYDQMITVNSQTLNSFYKAEFAEAQEKGNSDFKVPGINEVEVRPQLSFRRS